MDHKAGPVLVATVVATAMGVEKTATGLAGACPGRGAQVAVGPRGCRATKDCIAWPLFTTLLLMAMSWSLWQATPLLAPPPIPQAHWLQGWHPVHKLYV